MKKVISSAMPPTIVPHLSAASASIAAYLTSVTATTVTPNSQVTAKVVIIDAGITNYSYLVRQISPDIPALIVQPDQDGIQQITAFLQTIQNLNQIHILCHGSPGYLYLGNTVLNLENLDTYKDQWQQWIQTLPDAEMLIYGCQVAKGKEGRTFIQALAHRTGMGIAASDSLTGSPALGGNWELEFQTSPVKSTILSFPGYPAVLTSFGSATNIKVGSFPVSVVLKDVNGDGKLDLLTANELSNDVSVRLGDGAGNFTGTTAIAVGSFPSSIALGDVNGDGKLDLLTTSRITNTVSVGLGNGTGTFMLIPNVAVGSFPYSIALDDVNGDGKLDILTANAGDNTVSVRLGNGDGSFSGSANVTVGSSPLSVVLGDVNGDGKLDLLTANTGDNTVSVQLGNGDGSFSGSSAIPVGAAPQDVTLGDVNGDGKLDILTANAGDNTVSVRLGNGDGSFSGSANVTVGSSPLSVVLGDVNGDGKLDLLTANTGSSNVSLQLGDGAGGFTSSDTIPVGSAPQSVLLEDVNGDGKLDILTANKFSSNVSVLLNTTPMVTVAAGVTPQESITEGTFIITLDVPAPAEGLTINFTLTDSTATTPADFTLVAGTNLATLTSGSFTIAAGATTATLRVIAPDDNIPDANETVKLNLANGDNYILGNLSSRSATLTIAEINHAPVLSDTVVVLNAVNEDAGIPTGSVGTLISQLIEFVGGDGQNNVSDSDAGAVTGIAITATDTSNGTWFFSIDNGTTWTDIGAVSDSNARLLAADSNTRLYFQATGDYNGTVNNAITFRAWDRTTGANGDTADTSTNGGLTAFSAETDTAAITVNSVNDAPNFTNGADQTIAEDAGAQTVTSWATALDRGAANEAGQSLTFLVSNDNTSLFSVQPTIDATGTLTFTPAANTSGTATVSVQLRDDGGTANGGIDTSAAQTFTINVNSVPDVTSVTIPTSGTYRVGQSLNFTVTFEEAVTVNTVGGTPSFPISLNTGGTVNAVYQAGSGTTDLSFVYVVAAGQLDLDGISVGNAIVLNGGTIRNGSSQDATLALNGVPDTSGILINAAAPSITNVTSTLADGNYQTGQVIPISITFSEAVTVTGTPQLTLETGTVDAVVNYSSGSNTTTLIFNYTVAAGDTSADLSYLATTALALNGGTIQNASGQDAVLTLPALGATGSLSINKAIVVDTTAPTIALTSTAPTTINSAFSVTATFNEAVTGFTIDDIAVVNGSISNFSGSGTTYSFEVIPTADGTVTVEVGAAVVQDAAGNSNTAATPLSRTVNSAAPTVTLNSTAPATVSSSFNVTAVFNKEVTDFTIDDIAVVNGSISNFSGSGTTYSFEVIPTAGGTVTVDISEAVAQDLAGNGNLAATQLVRAFDNVAATVVGFTSSPLLITDATIPTGSLVLTATYSEDMDTARNPVIRFPVEDPSQSLTLVSGNWTNPRTYTATFNLVDANIDLANVDVQIADAADLSGRPQVAATFSDRFSIATANPTVTFTSTPPTTANPAFAVTANFSEPVTNFIITDVTVNNGTVSNFTGSGSTYTFLVKPIGTDSITVTIAAGVAQDSIGNPNTAATLLLDPTDVTPPAQPPVPQLSTSSDTGVSQTDRITNQTRPTFTGIAEANSVVAIRAGDRLLGTTPVNASGNWSFTSPIALPEGQHRITLTLADASGNESLPSSGLNLTIDTTASTAVLSDVLPDIRETSVDGITLQFSEAISSLSLSNLVLTRDGIAVSLAGATLTSTDNRTWVLSNLTALTEQDGRYELTLTSGNVTDIAGNTLSANVSQTWLTGHTGEALPPIRFRGGRQGVRITGHNRTEVIEGSYKNDILRGRGGHDRLIGGNRNAFFGNDRLFGGRGNDVLLGGRNRDLLDGGTGNDVLLASRHHDRLLGGKGKDRLVGGDGDDVLIGGAGVDRLTGGKDRDTFVYNNLGQGGDLIQDFDSTLDLIDLRPIFGQPEFAGDNNFARFLQFVQLKQVGTNTEVSVDADGNGAGTTFTPLMTLQNVSIDGVRSRNFVIS